METPYMKHVDTDGGVRETRTPSLERFEGVKESLTPCHGDCKSVCSSSTFERPVDILVFFSFLSATAFIVPVEVVGGATAAGRLHDRGAGK